MELTVPVSNISSVASLVRSVVGAGVLIWTNECRTPFERIGPPWSWLTTLPSDLDLISLDMYSRSWL